MVVLSRLKIIAITTGLTFGLSGCFSSNPSEEDAKKAFVEQYKSPMYSDAVVVDNVKKTNGMEMEQAGAKAYQMDVDVTIKYPKGIECKNKWEGICAIYPGKTIAPGTLETKAHKLIFVKTENGWKLGMAM